MNGLPKREIKNILNGSDARLKIAQGALISYEAVASTYGPSGNNVILGMPYGDATLTRDGVTVAKRIVLKDRAKDNAAQILKQGSEKTNKSAGDGTTATVVLAHHLFNRGNKQIRGRFLSKLLSFVVLRLAVLFRSKKFATYSTRLAKKFNSMLIKRQINEDSLKVIEFLKSEAVSADNHLLDVATVSAGDPAVGALVKDTLVDIGTNGGITIREQDYPTLDVEKVGGYYFDRGFFALNQLVEFLKPLIFVTNKQLAVNADIVPLIQRVIDGDNKNLIIIGDVRMNSEAMNTLLINASQNKLNGIVIPPPAFNEDGLQFMQDIALYVGARLFLNGDDIESVKTSDEWFGTAGRVQVSPDKAILFNGGGAQEDVDSRAAELKTQIDSEKDSHRKDNLEQRYAKLTGKIAIVNVGGSTPTEMEELRYRVEDSIEATKSAMADGVLPGGATMLVRAAQLDISPLFKGALLDTFRKLMNNAAEPADFRLEQIKRSPKGYGFNLRDMTDEPIDLTKAGIFDAARSIIQTVENATSAAGSLLTVGTIVDPIDQDDDEHVN